MAEPHPACDVDARTAVPVPAWLLALGLLVGSGGALGAATLGWAGVVVIVAVLALGYSALMLWSSWPRPSTDDERL